MPRTGWATAGHRLTSSALEAAMEAAMAAAAMTKKAKEAMTILAAAVAATEPPRMLRAQPTPVPRQVPTGAVMVVEGC